MKSAGKPPIGWFALDIMRQEARKWDWVALMIDVCPDDLKTCTCEFRKRCCQAATLSAGGT